MKKQILVAVLAASMAVGAGLPAAAGMFGAGDGVNGTSCVCRDAGERSPGRHLEMLAVALDLSQEQKEQIEALVAAERSKNQQAHEQLREGRQELKALLNGAAFDEAAVRALAAKQAQERIDLMVERAKVRSEVLALLTPEQQVKAQELWDVMGERPRRKGMGRR